MLYPTELHAPKFFNFFKEDLNISNLANLIKECLKTIFLNTLKIKNFRNHKSFEIDLKEQRAIVLGCNGIGKSNLLESVEFMSQLKSNRALSDKDFVILQNHGILTTGTMVDTTIWYFLNMEDACKSQLLAEAVGKPMVIPHDTACATRDYVANDLSAYVSFQPTVDVLWEEEPDLLD